MSNPIRYVGVSVLDEGNALAGLVINEPTQLTQNIYIAIAERALAKAEAYRLKGDAFLAKGKNRRADQAFRIAERAMLRFQTMAALCG